MSERSTVITLHESLLIGVGGRRKCYRHPENPRLCVKVYHSASNDASKTLKKEIVELKELKRLLSKTTSIIIPKFYGTVETNFGCGYLFEYILNDDGTDCHTLCQWLDKYPLQAETLRNKLYQQIYDDCIVLSDLHMENILIKEMENNEIQFALVDGLGEPTLIKVRTLFPYFLRRNLPKRFRYLDSQLAQRAAKLKMNSAPTASQ